MMQLLFLEARGVSHLILARDGPCCRGPCPVALVPSNKGEGNALSWSEKLYQSHCFGNYSITHAKDRQPGLKMSKREAEMIRKPGEALRCSCPCLLQSWLCQAATLCPRPQVFAAGVVRLGPDRWFCLLSK